MACAFEILSVVWSEKYASTPTSPGRRTWSPSPKENLSHVDCSGSTNTAALASPTVVTFPSKSLSTVYRTASLVALFGGEKVVSTARR